MFRDRIQDKYESLSPRFRTLADFILENTLDVGFLTATELARRVGVDPATVVRFSQELGYSGYRELSREIKLYINQKLALRFKKGAPKGEDLPGQLTVTIDELSDRVLDLKADAEQIAEAAEKLNAAKRVFITGKNEGYGLALMWETYLSLLGIPAYSVRAEAARAALFLRDVTDEDLLVVISLGLDPDVEVGHMLSAAQEQGVRTLSITTSPTLLPARQADTNLIVPAKTPSGYPSFDTLVALLSILWQTLILLNEEKAHEGVESAMKALNSLMEQRGRVPEYDMATMRRLWEQT